MIESVARKPSSSGLNCRMETRLGIRFQFGKNWKRFLDVLDDDRIANAELSLRQMLGMTDLEGKTFLDVGSGSGLFSLAARRLGARVHSFDFDPDSVACARELRQRFFPRDDRWTIEEGSILDEEYVTGLGKYDVVYAWGVLHHTGSMQRAIQLAASATGDDGLLFISIYNNQGRRSKRWKAVKQLYNRLPAPLQPLLVAGLVAGFESLNGILHLFDLSNPLPFRRWRQYKKSRGMSKWHDWIDWCGGLPFEVAKPEEIILPLRKSGFALENLHTVAGGLGCNQYVFRREPGLAR
jgi:2-polyprenyl-6-hydroxyphenyl methylase/3-demethylubiquinone-9 3-methyltransferase